MELGIARFVTPTPIRRSREDATLVSPVQSFLAEVELADRLGITFFTVGEHHSAEFIDSSPVVLLAAAAARTQHIRLSSGVTVLSANDPVRCFEDFATLDQISNGRAEMIVGRGAYAETFSLFGLDGEHYDAIFKEKLDLLLRLRANEFIRWQGRFRPALTGQGVYPRPVQVEMPIWLGVGGSPSSAVRAGTLGLPLALGIIGGTFAQQRETVALYREAGARAGQSPSRLKVCISCIGFLADSQREALDRFYPAYEEIFGPLGRKVGWPPLTRQRFERMCSHEAALVVGGPDEVADKLQHIDEVLGGVDRVNLQMSLGSMPLDQRLHSVQLWSEQVRGFQATKAAAQTASR